MGNLDFSVLASFRWALAKGLLYTFEIFIVCGLASLLLGFLIALARVSHSRFLQFFSATYVEILRGTPVLITLFWVFFCFPILFGFEFGPFTSATIALTLFTSAITSESYRSALKSISSDQYDACRALGITGRVQAIYIVAPQAIIRAIPNLMSNMVSLFKESALVSAVGVAELMYTAQNISNITARPIEVLTTAAMIYFAFGWLMSRLVNLLERRLLVRFG